MPQFRKKPVVIEAFQVESSFASEPPKWFKDAIRRGDVWGSPGIKWTIKTLEGDVSAGKGDWIIQGVAGELYPCKHDIFLATYEPA